MVAATEYISFGFTDELNRLKRRNINNTNRKFYNCGGYALGTFSWYCPHDERDYDIYNKFFTMEERTKMAVDYMLKDFPDLRVISSIKEVETDEFLIAFRLSEDDFHYMVKKENHKWYSKSGSCPKIDTFPQEMVLSECWVMDDGYYYDGPLVLFAKKKFFKKIPKNY